MLSLCAFLFFFNDTATTEIYTLSLHDALPIFLRQTFYGLRVHMRVCWPGVITRLSVTPADVHELSVLPQLLESTRGLAVRSEEHTSELQSRQYLVCRLLLEKKKKNTILYNHMT